MHILGMICPKVFVLLHIANGICFVFSLHADRAKLRVNGQSLQNIEYSTKLPTVQEPEIHPVDDFLPAPRGAVPSCASELMTLCTEVEKYPR